jgi:uncharacterized membrane protein
MNKSQFLKQLAAKLEGLRQHEIDSTIFYYSEMIDDRVEDGMSEEEAVAAPETWTISYGKSCCPAR